MSKIVRVVQLETCTSLVNFHLRFTEDVQAIWPKENSFFCITLRQVKTREQESLKLDKKMEAIENR